MRAMLFINNIDKTLCIKKVFSSTYDNYWGWERVTPAFLLAGTPCPNILTEFVTYYSISNWHKNSITDVWEGPNYTSEKIPLEFFYRETRNISKWLNRLFTNRNFYKICENNLQNHFHEIHKLNQLPSLIFLPRAKIICSEFSLQLFHKKNELWRQGWR